MHSKTVRYIGILLPSAMLLASASVFAAGAAKVEFVWGTAYALSASGEKRGLGKDDGIDVGETVISEKALVQLRFTDGGFVSLAPNSAFRVNAYSYRDVPDGSERVSMELLKGGLRTISGLIGKAHQAAYEMKTAVATVGIRGTQYTVVYGEGVSGTVSAGAIAVCNAGGCVDVAQGQSYYVKDLDTPPILVSKAAFLPPTQPSGARHQERGEKKSAKVDVTPGPQAFKDRDEGKGSERSASKMRSANRGPSGDIASDITSKRGKSDIAEDFNQFEDATFQKKQWEEALKVLDSEHGSASLESKTASRHNRASVLEIFPLQGKLDDNPGESLSGKGKTSLK